MSNTKTTKRALLTSVMALMLCFAMLTGTTFAWFTDTETSSNNRIVAGTLDVDLLMDKEVNGTYTSIAGGSGDIFSEGTTANKTNATLWEPGATHVAYLAVRNLGNLALKYNIVLNVTDEDATDAVNLADVLEVAVVNFDEAPTDAERIVAWDANATAPTISSLFVGTSNVILAAPNGKLENTNDTDYFAIAVHMQEEAGNEYQGKSICIDIAVNATQLNAEEDAFGKDYDEPAKDAIPQHASASISVDPSDANAVYDVKATDSKGVTLASVNVKADALAADAEFVTLAVERLAAVDGNVTVEDGNLAKSYEISLDGIKEDNTEPVTVQLYVGEGLGSSSDVKLYHKDELVTNAFYNPSTGYVIFEITNFSPFTVVYPETPVVVVPDGDFPIADLTETDDVADWSTGKLMKPANDEVLEATFLFKAPHNSENIDSCTYKDWICDYYVMMDLGDGVDVLPEGTIVLGGNYGDWGWNGFVNPEVPTNEWIPLLGSVTENPWTYSMIVGLVEEFVCGVGRSVEYMADESEDKVDLAGATFTVALRLSNPDNADEYYDVNTVKYTFGETFGEGNAVIINATK